MYIVAPSYQNKYAFFNIITCKSRMPANLKKILLNINFAKLLQANVMYCAIILRNLKIQNVKFDQE